MQNASYKTGLNAISATEWIDLRCCGNFLHDKSEKRKRKKTQMNSPVISVYQLQNIVITK